MEWDEGRFPAVLTHHISRFPSGLQITAMGKPQNAYSDPAFETRNSRSADYCQLKTVCQFMTVIPAFS